MTKIIKLNQGKETLVSDEDFDKVSKYKWSYVFGARTQRVQTSINGRYALLHRFIMNTPKGMDTDHINGNRLDNRRENLRICTHQENMFNQKGLNKTSIYKGVMKPTKNKKWVTTIKHNYKLIYIGSFKTEKQAAMAYDIWAYDLFGKYAKLNFERAI